MGSSSQILEAIPIYKNFYIGLSKNFLRFTLEVTVSAQITCAELNPSEITDLNIDSIKNSSGKQGLIFHSEDSWQELIYNKAFQLVLRNDPENQEENKNQRDEENSVVLEFDNLADMNPFLMDLKSCYNTWKGLFFKEYIKLAVEQAETIKNPNHHSWILWYPIVGKNLKESLLTSTPEGNLAGAGNKINVTTQESQWARLIH